MKRKQLIALLGSISLLLTSCSGQPVYAEEAVTEGELLMETIPDEEGLIMQEMDESAYEADESQEEPQDQADQPADTENMAADTSKDTAGEADAGQSSETESLPETTGGEEFTEQQTDVPDEPASEAATEKPTEKVTEAVTERQTEAVTEQHTETEIPTEGSSETETAEETQTEAVSETQPESSAETENLTEAGIEELTEAESEQISEEETEELTEDMTEDAEEEELFDDYGDVSYGGSGGYYWDESWFVSPDFRFTQVDKEYALVGKNGGTFAYEKDDNLARKVGEIPYGGVVCILKEKDGWCYIESGAIRGFVPESDLTKGESAQSLVDMIGEKALTQGELLCERADNQAFTYTKTTTYPVVARKVYAMSLTPAWVYEYPDTSSRFVGDVVNGSLLYVLKDCGNDWFFIESGDVRGFVEKAILLYGTGAQEIVMDLGEENAQLAEELVSPQDNRSVYYTLLSVKSAGDGIGEEICNTATRFVGNLPYVYGGTSLTSGADCSGFVQSVFAGYGISLPRTAQEQGACGQAVLSLEEAKPGDVVYYASGPHVGIYLGNGKVVQCSGREYNTPENPGKGPTISSVDYMPITSIRRYLIIRDETSADGGYRTDDTPYTLEQLETIWAIVAQEDNGSYDGALAVISSAMNRTESQAWSYEGSNALAQLTAAGQYCYSMDSYWIPRLHGNVPDYVKQAVEDCLKHGIRNHNHMSFRSTRGKTTGATAVQIGGNWYFGS